MKDVNSSENLTINSYLQNQRQETGRQTFKIFKRDKRSAQELLKASKEARK